MEKSNYTQERIYVTSNENLKQIFESLDKPAKKVLTVGSSKDQFYNAIFYGADFVTIADNSRYTKPFGDLKDSCINTLDYKDFINFIYDIPEFIDKENDLYLKAYENIDPTSKDFWKIDYEQNKEYIARIIDVDVDLEGSRFYQSEKNYNKLKEILKKNQFKSNLIQADLTEFPKLVDEKYDLILLSNVDDYFIDKTNGQKIYAFVDAVRNLYEHNLNEDGVIQITSSMNKNNKPKTEFYNGIKNLFNGGEFFTVNGSGLYSNYGSSNVSLFVKKAQKTFLKEDEIEKN